MYKKSICAVSIFAVLFCSCVTSLAHPGRTDSKGGHYNRSTGEYHYHHGYPAHQHTNGVCPYSFDDKTGQNSSKNVTQNIGTRLEKKEYGKEEKYNYIEVDDAIYYCFTTNFTSFITFPIAIFLARFGKPKEWAWAWLGIGIFVSGAILYNDYTQDINSGLLVLAATSEIIMSAVSIFLILKMYKLRGKTVSKKISSKKIKKSLDKKPIFDYKFKEPFRFISINQITKNNGKTEYGRCRYLFSDENYKYYGFTPELYKFVSGEYIIRADKENEENVVFFGKSSDLCYLFCNHIFLFERKILMDNTVTCVDTENGNSETYSWFNVPGGYSGHFSDYDKIKNIHTDYKEKVMIIEVVRMKCDFRNNEIGIIEEYTLFVKEKNGKFVAEKIAFQEIKRE